MKKILTLCVVTLSLAGVATGCRSGAGVKTANHAVGVGAGAH